MAASYYDHQYHENERERERKKQRMMEMFNRNSNISNKASSNNDSNQSLDIASTDERVPPPQHERGPKEKVVFHTYPPYGDRYVPEPGASLRARRGSGRVMAATEERWNPAEKERERDRERNRLAERDRERDRQRDRDREKERSDYRPTNWNMQREPGHPASIYGRAPNRDDRDFHVRGKWENEEKGMRHSQNEGRKVTIKKEQSRTELGSHDYKFEDKEGQQWTKDKKNGARVKREITPENRTEAKRQRFHDGISESRTMLNLDGLNKTTPKHANLAAPDPVNKMPDLGIPTSPTLRGPQTPQRAQPSLFYSSPESSQEIRAVMTMDIDTIAPNHQPQTQKPILSIVAKTAEGPSPSVFLDVYPEDLGSETTGGSTTYDVIIGLVCGEDKQTVLLQACRLNRHGSDVPPHWSSHKNLGGELDFMAKAIFHRQETERVQYSVPGLDYIPRGRIIDQVFRYIDRNVDQHLLRMKLYGYEWITCTFIPDPDQFVGKKKRGVPESENGVSVSPGGASGSPAVKEKSVRMHVSQKVCQEDSQVTPYRRVMQLGNRRPGPFYESEGSNESTPRCTVREEA